MPIDGLVSGLDTTAIIKQLMDVERIPQTLLSTTKTSVQAKLDAYGSIRAKLGALDTAATALSRPTDWRVRTATSSSDAVTATATSTADLGSVSFTVDALAAAHSVRSGNTIAATDTVIASGGTVELTTSTGAHTVAVGGGTLAEVTAAINAADLGVRAAAVNTGSGYRLQLTAGATGAASSFDVTAGLDAAVGGTVVARTGADALLTIGSGPGAYGVTSSSNTFSDLLPGLTVTARSVSTTPVTIQVDDDVDALVTKIQALVDAANAAKAEIATRTAYDPNSRKGAALAGDSTARRISNELSRAVSDAVGASSLGSAGAAGVAIDRFGKLTFDAARFRDAYAEDPDAVRALFAQEGAATGSVSYVGAGDRTQPGTYDVVVTSAATGASATGLTGPWPLGVAQTVRVRVGTTEVAVDVSPTDTAADAAGALQSALDGAGLALLATVDGGGGLRVATSGVGAAATFDVAWDAITWSTHSGTDVVGTVDGVAATGVGATLTVPRSDNRLGGLSVTVAGTATGTVGTVSYDRGVAQRLASVVDRAIDATDGYLTTTEAGSSRRIADLDTSIKAYDVRLAARETRLRTQFAALEVALGKLKDQSSWLTSQLSGLSGSSG